MNKKFTVSLPQDTIRALKSHCALRDLKVQVAVNLAILKSIDNYNETVKKHNETTTAISRNLRSFLAETSSGAKRQSQRD
jgi:hypothetical protein